MTSGTAHLLEMLSNRVEALSAEGKYTEAMQAANTAIDKARQADMSDPSDAAGLAVALEIKGDLLRQQGYLEDARLVYSEALELIGDNPTYNEILARLSSSIGVIYDIAENSEETIVFYERAIALYESLDPPNVVEVADISNNLGFIYRDQGDFKTAEEVFLKGLEIYDRQFGKNHEKTATICNNIGALYIKTGNEDQAREMHTMALEARKEVFGDNHPDTAQSYANLALSLAQLGDMQKADEHFKSALSIYEKHLKEQSHEYAAVAENYAELLIALDNKKQANALIKKVQKNLAKVSHHQQH